VKAIVYAGSELELREVPRPTPKRHELLIRIRATTAAPADGKAGASKSDGASPSLRRGRPATVIPGQDLAGEVEAVGGKVTRFRIGDPVVAWSGLRLSTYAEYICLSERGAVFPKPANLTYEEAATLPVSGLDATYLLRRAKIQPGERVLVNGAGGNMGTYAVQIAKVLGAEVTGVDHTVKLDMLRSIGADHVLDYTRDDFLQTGETYDVIFDVVGSRSLADILPRLRPGGRYVTAVPRISEFLRSQWTTWRSGKKVILWVPRTVGRQAQDFAFLRQHVEAGRVKTIVDRSFPLEHAAEAHRYVESGHKKGNVIITVP
jgi:NADPH:quinone reductase-like Zn-dependent oxidoreductase